VPAINVNVPIFSGGVTSQRTQEAQHKLTLNKYDSEAKLRALIQETGDVFGDNYHVRFDDNYLDRLTDTKDNGEFHFYRELTLAWKTYHSTSREFIYEQTSTRTKPANRRSAGSYF
jgi:hypothetical protein